MKPFRDLPIRRKILLMTLLICGAVLFVAIAALFIFQVLNFRSNFQRDTATLAAIIANNSTAALAFKDHKAGAEVLGSLRANPAVLAASLVLPDGSPFAQFGKPEDIADLSHFPLVAGSRFTGRYLLHTQPVELDTKKVGTLYLCSDYRQTFLGLLGLYGLVILAIMVVSIILAVRLSGRLQRIITDPVLELAETARIVGEHKDYSLRATATSRGDELGRLTQSFNEMLSRIQGQDAALSRSQEKLEALIHSIDGIVWECTPDTFQFTFVSRQVERLLGYQPEEWLANPQFWQQKLHPEDAAQVIQTCPDRVARRQPYNYDYRMIAADGRTVWIRESGVVLIENDQPASVRGIFQDITEQKLAAAKLDKLNQQLVDASRQAGMAEVATGVLHNVGNVLNSVNVSTTLIQEKLRGSEVASLVKLGALLRQHEADLSAFFTADPKGKLVPRFIIQLADELGAEHALLQKEQDQLTHNIEHIKEIVAMQQNYAGVCGILERVSLADLVNDALQINATALARHGVQVARQYSDVPQAMADKHKVIQILVNLVRNAKFALNESGRPDKRLTVGIAMNGGNCLKVTVSDNGIGIPPENLARIFSHGFSTRRGGHGFGLHSGAIDAKEMGGRLSVHSDGAGQGATFALELPLAGQKAEPRTELAAE
jgi:PAS domain S-box-containing protein